LVLGVARTLTRAGSTPARTFELSVFGFLRVVENSGIPAERLKMSLIRRELTEAEHADIERRHAHHPPKDATVGERHKLAREVLIDATKRVMELLPERCREGSLFLTKMDEARMWANAAIALNQ